MTARARSPSLLPPGQGAREDGRTITLKPEDATSASAIARALPDPDELPEGTLVVVPGTVGGPRSLAQSVLSAFGHARTVPRALRCTALVARGYTKVGAAIDPSTRADLAWGYVPSRALLNLG